MTYDEMHEKAAEKIGHCRVRGGLTDEDVARQVLEAIGIVPEVAEVRFEAAPGHEVEA
jgi:urease accessory protein UreE